MESGEKYLEDFSDSITLGNDYAFKSSPLTTDDYNIDYFTYNIDNEYRTLNKDTLKFTDVVNSKFCEENTLYTFYAKYGSSDDWIKAGIYNPYEGKAIITDDEHIQQISERRVDFKGGTDAVAYKIEVNSAAYETKIYAGEFVNLKNSTAVMNAVKDKTLAYMANTVRFYAYNYKGNQVGSDRNWDFVRMIRAQKDSEIIKKAVSGTNNKKKKQYRITWQVSMNETVTTGAGGGTKLPIVQNGGTFYDLLPEGAVLDEKSIYITDDTGYEIEATNYTVTTENNYRDSNRTLVKVDITAPAPSYSLYYDTVHSWNDIKDYGSTVINPVAYETKNERITKGYYDDPSKPLITDSGPAFSDKKICQLMKNLHEGVKKDNPKFIYHQGEFDILAITAGTAGLSKKVLGDNSNDYSSSAQTYTGNEYSYKIRYQNTFTTRATNLIFYDSLENYTTPEGKTSDWHGTLSGLGLNQLTEKGVAPAVYISTVENLELNTHHDLADTSIWTRVNPDSDLSSAKAVAIDARYTADGSNFVLEKGDSLTAYLYMKAPEYDVVKMERGYPYAYNNVYASSTLTDGLNSNDYFVHQDYTSIYYLVAGDLNIKKVNQNNHSEAVSGVKYRLFGTSGYGNNVSTILSTAADGTILFKNVEKGNYILQEYDSGDDWLIDSTEYNVTIDENGNTIVENGDYSTGVLTLTDAPRVHADVRFSKKDLVTMRNVGGAKFLLKGTSDYGKTITKFATAANATGLVSFQNIEKGTYELTEVGTVNGYALNSNHYAVTVDESGNVTVSIASGDKDLLKTEPGSLTVIYNEPLHNVTVLKQNNYDYGAVEGVTFKLSGTSDNGTAVDQNQTTGTSGMATFTGIESGTYTITEVAVEDHTDGINVELDTTPKVITVDKFGNSTIEGTNKDSQGNTIIVDNAKADKTITVIKKFNDDGTVDHSKDLPTIHASTNDPTKSSSAKSNESAISEASLEDVQDEKSVVDMIIDGIKNAGKAIKGIFITETHAEELNWYNDWTYTLDTSGRKIQLKNYNGYATTYEIPASATINGIRYTTTIGNGMVSTGTIQNLSVSSGVKASTSLTSLFSGNTVLINVDLRNLDCSETNRIDFMFNNCTNLRQVNLSGLNTSEVTDMKSMFSGCTSLIDVDFSGMDTSKVQKMHWLFYGCSSIKKIDLSMLNLPNINGTQEMFGKCASLECLDISSFELADNSAIGTPLLGCDNLKEISLPVSKYTFWLLSPNGKASSKVSRIKIGKGLEKKVASFYGSPEAKKQQTECGSEEGYTGNWTAISEYNHSNGSDLTPDIDNKYVSFKQTYLSITDEQWAANPDGIWFVWEKEGQDLNNQHYVSKAANFYTPVYDASGKVKKTPEQTFTKDGYWQKIDASTYSYTFYAVDTNRPFYIWEDEMAGYESSNTAANPIRIENGSETATITNTATTLHDLQFGSLKVAKTLVNSTSTDKFSFSVTLTKADGTALSGLKAFGKTAFRDGVAKFSLAGGESVDITGIPAGYHYTVAEDAVLGYETTSSGSEGTITANQTVTAAFTNTAAADGTGSTGTLVIKKQATGNLPAHMDFKLNVFIYNLVPDTTYQYKYQLSDGTDETGSFTSDKQGRAVFNHYFEKDEQLEIPGLPDGSYAVVVQDAVKQSITSYTVESTTDNIGKQADRNTAENRELSTADEPIAADNTKTITFSDAVEITKDLFIGKIVDGATTDQKFEMTIDISGLKPNSVLNTDSIGRITADADGYATKSFFLSHHEGVEISGLPVGATYTVTETGTPDYQGEYEIRGKQTDTGAAISLDDRSAAPTDEFASGVGMTARDMATEPVTIGADDYSVHRVLILNHYVKTYNLSVSKTVTGNMGNRSESFDFTVKFPSTLYGRKITTTKPDGSPAYTQVSSTGIANFSLKHGETIVFSGLTADEITALKKAVNYGVSEESYAEEGYKTTYDTAETDGSLNVYVTNFRTSGVPTGNHVGTGVAASMIIGLAALAYILAERRKH